MRSAGNEEKIDLDESPVAVATGEERSVLYSSRREQSMIDSFAKASLT
jgi:hypothetical protein